ncbi:DUF2076 domain-containing protein [Ancylobacter sp. 6x-1]|uniref:DUF2076 domain-containing protein n=1 Tax=Ancylobacter crimeensis TaxID=2579147 RepID=A0ABT0DAU2_9HYPH|nr:DUF2076 domain-containing protein [Ancylobacter crimeensis]MCK0197083.1 DUF2076 domain-containing protein [Ancylobacter crimeensis]
MNAEERALIDGLFEKMAPIANAPRDPDAEDLINRHVVAAPHAPYALAQTVLVQEHALNQAAQRIAALEAELKAAKDEAAKPSSGGSFLGGLLGGGLGGSLGAAARSTSVPAAGQRTISPQADYQGGAQAAQPGYGQGGYGQAGYGQGGGGFQQGGYGQQPGFQQAAPQGRFGGGFGGGGFLSSALTTAAGVAGGALLFDGIRSMMGGAGSPFGGHATENVTENITQNITENTKDGVSAASPWGDSAKDAGDAGSDTAGQGVTNGLWPFGGDDTAAGTDSGTDLADYGNDDGGFLDDSSDDSGWA